MRYLSLHLPFLATDRIRRCLLLPSPLRGGVGGGGQRALHDKPRRTAGLRKIEGNLPLVTTAKAKSAYRLVALDAAALALGLRSGMALADARAMHPRLDVRDADPEGERATRDALVDGCRRFTPLAAPDGEGAMLDITGASHLFGGEAALLAEMRARLAAQGFASNLAVADTPGAAWALARYDPGLLAPDTSTPLREKRFAPMPLAALGLDPQIVAQLGQAGLRRIGDLLMRPRAPIVARFGHAIHDRLDEVMGRSRRPISPRFEAPPFVTERRFAEGIARREDVEATILALAHDLCGLLARHGEGARQLDVALYRVDGLVKHIAAGTSRPLRDPHAMARLFRERIEAAGEDGLETGYGFDVVRLAALAAERLDGVQPNWAETEGDVADLANLVDRLGARFGLDRVSRLAVADAHVPKFCFATASFPSPACGRRWPSRQRGADEGTHGARDEDKRSGRLPHPTSAHAEATFSRKREKEGPALPERPLRLLDQPEPVDAIAEIPDRPPARFTWRRVTHHVAAIEGPERIAPEWWNGPGGLTRDYFRAEDTDGRRFWLYREGLYRETAEPRWFLHGLFG